MEKQQQRSRLDDAAVSALQNLRVGQLVELEFVKNKPEIPYPGAARMGIHKSIRFVFHPDQTSWLEKRVFSGGFVSMRPKTAFEAMKAEFGNTFRTDTMTPMWLPQDKIEDWLAKRVKQEKLSRAVARKESKKDATQEQAQKKNPTRKQNSKKKAASARTRVDTMSDDDDDEESDSEFFVAGSDEDEE